MANLSDLSVTKSQSSRWQQLAALLCYPRLLLHPRVHGSRAAARLSQAPRAIHYPGHQAHHTRRRRCLNRISRRQCAQISEGNYREHPTEGESRGKAWRHLSRKAWVENLVTSGPPYWGVWPVAVSIEVKRSRCAREQTNIDCQQWRPRSPASSACSFSGFVTVVTKSEIISHDCGPCSSRAYYPVAPTRPAQLQKVFAGGYLKLVCPAKAGV